MIEGKGTGLVIAGIVAIVAIVGLVLMFKSPGVTGAQAVPTKVPCYVIGIVDGQECTRAGFEVPNMQIANRITEHAPNIRCNPVSLPQSCR